VRHSGRIRPVKALGTTFGEGASDIFSCDGAFSVVCPSKRRCFSRATSGCWLFHNRPNQDNHHHLNLTANPETISRQFTVPDKLILATQPHRSVYETLKSTNSWGTVVEKHSKWMGFWRAMADGYVQDGLR